MPREYKTVQVVTTVDGVVTRSEEHKKLLSLSCVFCGAEAPRLDDDRSRWGRSQYDVAQVKIQMRTGSAYPEGGSIEQKGFDVCPDCFESRVIPWFESNGAKPETQEKDW